MRTVNFKRYTVDYLYIWLIKTMKRKIENSWWVGGYTWPLWNRNSEGVGVGLIGRTIRGGGMDIFWNHTLVSVDLKYFFLCTRYLSGWTASYDEYHYNRFVLHLTKVPCDHFWLTCTFVLGGKGNAYFCTNSIICMDFSISSWFIDYSNMLNRFSNRGKTAISKFKST